MKDRLGRAAAREAARIFVNSYIKQGLQWDVHNIEKCLPDGWVIPGGNQMDGHFMPPTITIISEALQTLARRIPASPSHQP